MGDKELGDTIARDLEKEVVIGNCTSKVCLIRKGLGKRGGERKGAD